MSDIDDLLDVQLEDLEDLPEFKNYPAGSHRVLATMSLKDINGSRCVDLSFKLVETLELVNDSDTPPAEGDTSSTMFKLDNEYGRGNFKKLALPMQEALGCNTIRETIEAVQEVEVVILTSLRADKNDKEKFYLNVKEMNLV